MVQAQIKMMWMKVNIERNEGEKDRRKKNNKLR
jgi:hypothetical protein